jgi:single-strand DNA-binding protein
MNNVSLVGRIGTDIDNRQIKPDCSMSSFLLAVHRTKDETDWIPCKAWGKTGEFIAQYFGKGKMIALEGEIRTSTYEKDGEKRKTWEVNVRRASFCEGRSNSDAPAAANPYDTDMCPF